MLTMPYNHAQPTNKVGLTAGRLPMMQSLCLQMLSSYVRQARTYLFSQVLPHPGGP